MKRRAFCLFVLIALVSAAPVFAQTATVTGKISDGRGRPLANLTVSVAGKISFTDIRGVYRIRNVPWGSQVKMQIKKSGKIIRNTTVDIRAALITRDERLP